MSERESARAWARRHGISLPPEEEQQRAVDRETGKRIAEEPCPGCEEKARRLDVAKGNLSHCNEQYSRIAEAAGVPDTGVVEITENVRALREEAESLRARVRKLGEVVRELLDIDESTSKKSDELLVRIASSRSGDATWCAAILNVRAALRGEDARGEG